MAAPDESKLPKICPKLFAWGANTHGQLCLGHQEDVPIPTEVQPEKLGPLAVDKIVQICGGGSHVVFLSGEGEVYTCGQNNRGQLGLGSAVERTSTLMPVGGICGRVVKVACGWEHTLCLNENGKVWGWGANNYSQLGVCLNSEFAAKPTEIKIGSDSRIADIAAGLRHSLAVTDSGNVFVWGSGRRGQLGPDCADSTSIPISLKSVQGTDGTSKIISVACGSHHSLALTDTGSVFAWGCNRFGQLGLDPGCISQRSEPTRIPPEYFANSRILRIHVGWSHNIAISGSDCCPVSWGRNDYGQLGRQGVSWIPGPLDLPTPLLQVSSGAEHNVGISVDGTAVSFGWNEHGICGTGGEDHVVTPQPIRTLRNGNCTLIGTGCGSSFAVVSSECI